MTISPIRTAIIGAGYIADWHAEALKMTPGAELVAVCDLSSSAADGFAAAHGVAAYHDLDAMIAADICDAVHILTPPNSHAALAETCLRAGLHVLVEKPVALSAEDTRKIVAVAEESGKTFAAGHNFLGLPSYQRLKDAVRAGKLGKITSAEINWHFPLAPLRSGPFGLWLLQEPKNLLLELGPHLFGFAVDLFGAPEIEYLSLGKPIALPADTDRPQSWRILARAGDVDVTLNISLVETMDDRSVTVRGSSAQARLDYAQDTLVVAAENASDIVVNPLRRQLSQSAQALREGAVNLARQLSSLNRKSAYGLSFQGAFAAFYDSLQSQNPLDERFDGAAAVQVMQAIDDTLALMPAPAEKPRPQSNKTPKPNVLVIGGTGFIGRALTRKLVARGHDVRVLSRGRTGPFDDIADHVELFSAPLTDRAALLAAMEGIEAVYHLGKSLDKSWEACLKNDVGVTVGIAEAALEAGVKRFVYTGTIASYDMSDPAVTITEKTGFSDDMSDRNLYARSKAKCEQELEILHHTKGLPLVIARPGIVVGAGGPLQHWGIGRWHGAGAVRIWGDGSNILPFVLIDDVAEALVLMMEKDAAVGESFNLVADPMMSARDYFAAIHQNLGAKIAVSPGNLTAFWLADAVKYALKRHALRRRDAIRPSRADWKSRAHLSPFDNSHSKSLLGWTPESSKAEFIRSAITEANLLGF
ncbi:NAD-dependent epimerase/dehydratase family protein [Cognatishimia sp. SS12]|uniref:NAD-dependent epimerase/dehydratase family protein n=1 Tax=Cognatishimia sp. SS12 TaxID=2979465 RepID=UPI00232DA031|nr:NAD-dependent epimerase/dehydratase family protein [Cognatishimia sp. SS12]MDC0736829.1 NAD-dependent epimerase/dehydratase family protein [Cognatishimia sp. SS12]